MFFFTTLTQARHVRHQAALTTALLVVATACADGSASEDVLLAARGGNELQVMVRDSSLVTTDTATIRVTQVPRTATGNGSTSSVKFRTSDSTIATVTTNGLVTAMREGTATITARAPGNHTAVIDFVVSAADPQAEPRTEPPVTPPVTPPADSTPSAPPAPPAPPVVQGPLPSFVTPTLPQAQVNVDLPSAASRSFRIPAGDAGALQSALNAAVGGDEIVLANGATYVGSFHLPNRAGGGTVVLRSESVPVSSRTRITPAQAGSLATLLTNSVFAALIADDGAHGWRVIGVRMRLADGVDDNYGIVTIGSGSQTAVDQFPRDIVLDRIFVQGSTTGRTSRCVSLNGNGLALIDSWLTECHVRDRDAQAVGVWTGQGPFLIENNYLEGSGQGIMLGGSDPRVQGVTPSDITIRRNHIFKPLGWAGRWSVKAAFEIKHAQRVLFEGNVIENHWADAQVGFAVLLQATSQDRLASWTVVRDITMRLNTIRNSRSGINILSRIENGIELQRSRRMLMQDNVLESVGRDPISGSPGRFVQLLDDLEDVTIVQNTFFGTGAAIDLMLDGDPITRLVFANNVFSSAGYGIIGSGFAEGSSSLDRFAPGAVATGNAFVGLTGLRYPAGNVFPITLSLSDFVDSYRGDFSLRPESAFALLNGARTGVNGAALVSATQNVTAR